MTAPRLWLASALAAALLFSLWPGLDLQVTGWFWAPSQGFFLGNWPPFRLAHAALPALTWTIVLGLLALLAFVILAERVLGRFDRRTILFLLLSTALGPGLLTNTILKDHWGRARPSQIVEFGGAKSFTSALLPAGQCDRNCSFVSGDAAMAFSLVGFAFLPAIRRRRRQLAAAALVFGAFVGLARIAQGGHFLSDTVFAALLVTGTAWVCHRLIVQDRVFERPGWRSAIRALAAGTMRVAAFLAASSGVKWRKWLGFDFACAAAIAGAVAWLDRPIARFFAVGDDRLHDWLRWIGDLGLGQGWLIGSGGLAMLLLLLGRAPRFAARRERFVAWALVPSFVFLSVALSGLGTDLVKILIGRTRPKLYLADGMFDWGGLAWQADHWSMPSGHVANAAGLALALYFLWPRHVVAYAGFVALVALGRIGTDQHFLSDTIASLWLATLITCYLRGVVERRGLSLNDAKAGIIPPLPSVSLARLLAPWRAARSP